MQVIGYYNNTGIKATLVIHLINFKELKDNTMAVIGKKNKAQLGNSQMSVVSFWSSVHGDPPYFEGVSNYLIVFLSITMPFTYTNEEHSDMVFVYGFCNGSANAANIQKDKGPVSQSIGKPTNEIS